MLEVTDLKQVYPDGTCAISDLSFRLEPGQRVALVGANGAGKTSLLLSLMGVLPLAEGQVRVNDTVLSAQTVDEIRSQMGLVFQAPDDQLFMPVVREDVAFGPRNFGKSPAEAHRIVAQVLEQLGISHLADKSTTKLSGGEKRMVSIATVLAMDPKVLLFDEPTAFLDPKARRKLIHLLRGLPQTQLIATHDLTFACECCQRVLILSHGTLVADGDPRTLLYDQARMDAFGIEAIGYAEF